MRVLTVLAVLLAPGVAVPQEKKPEPKGEEVLGKISFNGKPLSGGTVMFVSKDGKATVAGAIAEDGTYKVLLPVGEYGVAITTAAPKKDDPKDPPKKVPVLKIPEKYGDVKTSGITYKVAKGKQTFDIDLTS